MAQVMCSELSEVYQISIRAIFRNIGSDAEGVTVSKKNSDMQIITDFV